jgi:hypothetical protein
VTENKYCLLHDSCTKELGVFYSSWSYIITLIMLVLVTAIRNKFVCSLQFAAFIEPHPQPSYVSNPVGLCPVPILQALSTRLSIVTTRQVSVARVFLTPNILENDVGEGFVKLLNCY